MAPDDTEADTPWSEQLGVVKYTDNLTYHYLGGVIMALAGEFTRAMDMLEIVRLFGPGTRARH